MPIHGNTVLEDAFERIVEHQREHTQIIRLCANGIYRHVEDLAHHPAFDDQYRQHVAALINAARAAPPRPGDNLTEEEQAAMALYNQRVAELNKDFCRLVPLREIHDRLLQIDYHAGRMEPGEEQRTLAQEALAILGGFPDSYVHEVRHYFNLML